MDRNPHKLYIFPIQRDGQQYTTVIHFYYSEGWLAIHDSYLLLLFRGMGSNPRQWSISTIQRDGQQSTTVIHFFYSPNVPIFTGGHIGEGLSAFALFVDFLEIGKKSIILILLVLFLVCTCFRFLWYRGIHKNGLGDVVSDVCYILYTIYLSLCTQTVETTSPEPFSSIPLYLKILLVLWLNSCFFLNYNYRAN